MLTAPRPTIREIIDDREESDWLPIVVLAGLSASWARMPDVPLPPGLSLRALVVGGGALGAFGSVIFVYVFAVVYGLIGRKLGGTGSNRDVRIAISWSQLPTACTFPLWVAMIALCGEKLFTPAHAHLSPGQGAAVGWFAVALIASSVWSFVLLFIGLREAHRMTTGQAFKLLLLGMTVVLAMAGAALAVGFLIR